MSNWKVFNKTGETLVLVTKMLPGVEWLNILIDANYKIEVNLSNEVTTKSEIIEKIGTNCRAIIGQLTENWDEELFQIFSSAGGVVYSNYAVGYDNVNVKAATKSEIAIGNTPGVLTETTSEMAVALTMACARRIVEADSFMRKGDFKGWLPNLFLGKRLYGGTVGIIGAGRIGFTYALTMVQAFQMNLIYFSNRENLTLEDTIDDYNRFLQKTNSNSVFVKRAMTIEELFSIGPAVSILMDGYVELDKLTSLRGTLVPATTINKSIAKIPLIGDILVGKKVGEGVFGISFKIKGPPKDLKTTVNPIKTLTPRFITRTIEKIKKN